MSGETVERPARKYSGRLVVLLVLFGLPLIAVPLLLSGTSTIHQVDLVSLRQRVRESSVVGSFSVKPGDWKSVPHWPETQSEIVLPDFLQKPKELNPTEWSKLTYGDLPDPLWRDFERSMPFAFITQIDNRNALPPGIADILAVKLAAASILDPGDQEDRNCLRALDEALFEGLAVTEAELKKQRRQRGYRPPAAGEAYAREVLGKLAELSDSQEGRRQARKILCLDR